MNVRWLLVASLLALSVSLQAAFPKPEGFVTDAANVLDSPTRSELARLLGDVEQQTSAEIALATVPSLDGMTVEEYANKLFREWGIGKKKIDNGVLVLVAPSERKMRIEVGYGLEPILPDGLAGSIIREDFLPKFRNDDDAGGIRAGVAHVADIVRRNHVLTAGERRALEESGRAPAYLTIPLFGVFVGLGAFMIGAGLRTKTFFPLIWGGGFGGIPFAMALIPLFNVSPLLLGVLAVAAAAWGYRRAPKSRMVRDMLGSSVRRTGRGSSGWEMGGGTSSGSSSSSGSSFGGGSSGGGGASGSW